MLEVPQLQKEEGLMAPGWGIALRRQREGEREIIYLQTGVKFLKEEQFVQRMWLIYRETGGGAKEEFWMSKLTGLNEEVNLELNG